MTYTFIGGKNREEFPEFEELFELVESQMGYLPNAYLAMAEKPELLNSFSSLISAVFKNSEIDLETKQLIALASSLSAGCKYCQSHTSHGAERAGVDSEKIAEILKYSTSDKYSEKERAVLDLAFLSGQSPNGTKKENFDKLLEFFSKDQILEIVSVIAAFGFLNRWNDTLGTVTEDEPKNFVNNELVPKGWEKF